MSKKFWCLSITVTIVLILSNDMTAFAAGEKPSSILNEFIAQTGGWWGVLREKALGIFKIVLVIDVCLFGIRMALPGSNAGEIFKEFISLLLFAGFIALVIVNYEEWSQAIAISGLSSLVTDLTGNSLGVDQPFSIASTLWMKTSEVSTAVGMTQLPRVMVYMAAVFLMVVALFFLSALMILAKCEFYIVANVGVLLIGLGGSKIFKDYATNVMRYVLSIGIKIFVIQLLANVGLAMISANSIINSAVVSNGGEATIEWATVFVLLAKVAILIVLAKTLPDSCAGMISGATVGGGNPMAAMAIGAATGGATKVAGMAKAGLDTAGAVKNSYDLAKLQGASGVGGTLKGMGAAFMEARGAAKEAKLQGSQSSTMSQLKSMSNMAKAQKNMEGKGDTSPSSQSSATTSETGSAAKKTQSLPPAPSEAKAAKNTSKPVDMRQP